MENEILGRPSAMTPLRTITPLSKYLALALFIILPFLGAWIGYTWAPEKVVEVERVVVSTKVEEQNKTNASETMRSSLMPDVANVNPSDIPLIDPQWTETSSEYGLQGHTSILNEQSNSILEKLFVSPDGKTEYYQVRAPREGLAYYTPIFYRTLDGESGEFSSTLTTLEGINWVQSTLGSSGKHDSKEWILSPDKRFLIYTDSTHNAMLDGYAVIGSGSSRIQNLLKVLDLNTREIIEIEVLSENEDVHSLSWSVELGGVEYVVDSYKYVLTPRKVSDQFSVVNEFIFGE